MMRKVKKSDNEEVTWVGLCHGWSEKKKKEKEKTEHFSRFQILFPSHDSSSVF